MRKFYELKIVIFFLPINLKMCYETVLLSTHNICFGSEIKKKIIPMLTVIWRPELLYVLKIMILKLAKISKSINCSFAQLAFSLRQTSKTHSGTSIYQASAKIDCRPNNNQCQMYDSTCIVWHDTA